MRTGTKIALLGLAVSTITSIVFGIIEINDNRKGKKRLNEKDIKMIADAIVEKQEEKAETRVELVEEVVSIINGEK